MHKCLFLRNNVSDGLWIWLLVSSWNGRRCIIRFVYMICYFTWVPFVLMANANSLRLSSLRRSVFDWTEPRPSWMWNDWFGPGWISLSRLSSWFPASPTRYNDICADGLAFVEQSSVITWPNFAARKLSDISSKTAASKTDNIQNAQELQQIMIQLLEILSTLCRPLCWPT